MVFGNKHILHIDDLQLQFTFLFRSLLPVTIKTLQYQNATYPMIHLCMLLPPLM